jgi:hypothetical protein
MYLCMSSLVLTAHATLEHGPRMTTNRLNNLQSPARYAEEKDDHVPRLSSFVVVSKGKRSFKVTELPLDLANL